MKYPETIPVKVKVEDKVLYVWWSGKWRSVCYYHITRRWNERWVHAKVLKTLRANVPLPVEVNINIKREEF